MEEIFASPVFRFAFFPLGSAVLGVMVKCATRSDKYAFIRKEDVGVGLELILTAILMFVALTTDRAVALQASNKHLAEALQIGPMDDSKVAALRSQIDVLANSLAWSGWQILLLFLGIWSVSTIVRRWGWKSETEMAPIIGIAMPLVLGIISLISVMAGAMQ